MSVIQFNKDSDYVIFSSVEEKDDYIKLFNKLGHDLYKPHYKTDGKFLMHRVSVCSSTDIIDYGYSTITKQDNTYLCANSMFNIKGFIFYRRGNFYLVNFPPETSDRQKNVILTSLYTEQHNYRLLVDVTSEFTEFFGLLSTTATTATTTTTKGIKMSKKKQQAQVMLVPALRQIFKTQDLTIGEITREITICVQVTNDGLIRAGYAVRHPDDKAETAEQKENAVHIRKRISQNRAENSKTNLLSTDYRVMNEVVATRGVMFAIAGDILHKIAKKKIEIKGIN